MTETCAWMSSLTESTTWVWCRRFLLMSTTTMNEVESHIFRWRIENTSWKVRAYGIYARVCWRIRNEKSDISDTKTRVQSTFHVVLCLSYAYWEIYHFGSLFTSNLSKMLKNYRYIPRNDNEVEVSALLVKKFVKNVMRVMIWGNPRTTRNPNRLFWMRYWKWYRINLSKMTGLNMSLFILNRRQSSFRKKHNLTLRLVLFFPFCCCFAGSQQFSSSTARQTKLFNSNLRDVFHFFYKKNTWRKTILFECLRRLRCKLLEPLKGGNFGAKLTHRCGFWLTYHFSHTWKNVVRDSYWS